MQTTNGKAGFSHLIKKSGNNNEVQQSHINWIYSVNSSCRGAVCLSNCRAWLDRLGWAYGRPQAAGEIAE
jgi:hypothetical protein